LARVAQSTSSVALLIAQKRTGFAIHNDSVSELRVNLGGAASVVDYLVAIPPGAYFEAPYGPLVAERSVFGIWVTSGSGAAQVTEL